MLLASNLSQCLGYDTTQPVTVDEMLHHCRAVKRGAKHPLIVGDMPFGSYEVSPEQALQVRTPFRALTLSLQPALCN